MKPITRKQALYEMRKEKVRKFLEFSLQIRMEEFNRTSKESLYIQRGKVEQELNIIDKMLDDKNPVLLPIDRSIPED